MVGRGGERRRRFGAAPVAGLAARGRRQVAGNARNPCGVVEAAPLIAARTRCTTHRRAKIHCPALLLYTAASGRGVSISHAAAVLYSRVMCTHRSYRRRRHYNNIISIIYFYTHTPRVSCFIYGHEVRAHRVTFRRPILLHARACVQYTCTRIPEPPPVVLRYARALPSVRRILYTAAAFVLPCRRAAAVALYYYGKPMRLTRLPVEFSRIIMS